MKKLYFFGAIALLSVYWLQNYADMNSGTDATVLYAGIYYGVLVFFLSLFVMFYITLLANRSKKQDSYIQIHIFMLAYASLFLTQNTQIFWFLTPVAQLAYGMAAILFVYYGYKVYLFQQKGLISKRHKIIWIGLIFVYIFILQRPTIAYVPDSMFTEENGIEYIQSNYTKINDELTEQCFIVGNAIEKIGDTQHINIPLIAHSSSMYDFSKASKYYFVSQNGVPQVIFPEFGKELLTNVLLKGNVDGELIFNGISFYNFAKKHTTECFPVKKM